MISSGRLQKIKTGTFGLERKEAGSVNMILRLRSGQARLLPILPKMEV